MLRQLQVENYTLIDRLELEFNPGFNLLTGETGSGKSIVVDAVELLLGGKASADVIRSGADRARITGVFTPSTFPASNNAPGTWEELRHLLAEAGIELPEAEDLILQRDILTGRRSRVFVNLQPATVALLRSMAPYLAEVHGQNEQQELFSPSAQLQMLDRFGGLSDLATTVREQFAVWKNLREQQRTLALRQQERLRQMDLWKFQANEIEQAAISPAEDERLESEKLLLTHAARIQANLASAYDLLYDSSNSAVSSMAVVCRKLEEVADVDPALNPIRESLLSTRVAMEDAAFTLRDRLSQLDSSPERLEEVENRLALLDRLKRKYGPSLEDVMRTWEQVSSDLRDVESTEELVSTLENRLNDAAAAYGKGARQLSLRRAETTKELKKQIERELKSLAMPGTVFEARLTSADAAAIEEWSGSGIDRVDFLISPNPGEPLRPLARIASGGEISRIMLALEMVTDARRDAAAGGNHTLVFDEVDAGIGGRAAEMVGKKLRQLGESRQVLCVTHLPQIASFAHHHFRVQKSERKGRTVTEVHYLQKSERAGELARMLSGSQLTDAVLKHAEQLLKTNS